MPNLLDLYREFQEEFENDSDDFDDPKPVIKKTKVKIVKAKKKSIPKVVKDLSWSKWVGDDISKTKCLCCGINEIKMNSFHCGHVMAEANGGETTVDNLRPICAACNTSMGTENLDVFRAKCGFVKNHSRDTGASLRVTNDNIVASASIGAASVSISLPVNKAIDAIKKAIF